MYIVLLAISLCGTLQSKNELNLTRAQLEDKVKGALVGSALGDAFGRATELLGTADAIRLKYGKDGIKSLQQITSCDWIYAPFKRKQAAYTSNTVFSLLVYDVCVKGRKKGLSHDEVVKNIARKIIDLFGDEKYTIDPHFSFHYYHKEAHQAAQRLAMCESYKKYWDKDYYLPEKSCALLQDNDSAVLPRAWPLGLVYADDPEKVETLAVFQTNLTHIHPTVIAASSTLALGIAAALQGNALESIVENMCVAASRYELADLSPLLRTVQAVHSGNVDSVQQQSYEKFFDEITAQHGYNAETAVAAVVYLLLAHAGNPKLALLHAVNAGGRTALIGSLVGAFLGASIGFNRLNEHFRADLELLENRQYFDKAVSDFMTIKDFNTADGFGFSNFVTYGCTLGAAASVGYIAYRLLK